MAGWISPTASILQGTPASIAPTTAAAKAGSGLPLPVMSSIFFGAMKGGAVNQKMDQMNDMVQQKNEATLKQGMKNQEVLNYNMQQAEDAAVRQDLITQMNFREAEGEAAAAAASIGSSSAQAIREASRNAAFASAEADRQLMSAAEQYDQASWANAQATQSTQGTIKYNPYLNILLSAGMATVPAMFETKYID